MPSAPPPLWQSDALRGKTLSLDEDQRICRDVTCDHTSEAYRHVKSVVNDARKDFDLHDLLLSTRREETYQPYPMGWPSLLRSVSPSVLELPSMVQEKYRGCQAMCFCGLFPTIGRAWASVDNSLFLWKYDSSGDVPIEYCGEDQAICAVGIVKPRPGVFLEAVKHILVLCTTAEVVLLGVCHLRRPGLSSSSEDDVTADITLQPLPMYNISSDGIVITCVATSSKGRIFLGGSDGHVYELLYNAADKWRQKKCSKVRLTGGLQQYLPSFLPVLLGFGASSAIDKLVVDDERSVLYSLSQTSAIQVFDLGASGLDPPQRVADISDFYAAANSATNGREVFRSGAGAAAERKAAAIRHLAPIPSSESSRLHLVAVTADGRRVYFTTGYSRQQQQGLYFTPGSANASHSQTAPKDRPTTLMAMIARPALPYTGSSLGRPTAAVASAGSGLAARSPVEVVSALYCQGSLLLSEAAGSDGRSTRLLMATRNSMVPLTAVNLMSGGMGVGVNGAFNGSGSAPSGLRETLTELDSIVAGETCALEAVPVRCPLEADMLRGIQHDELLGQIFTGPARFVLISTAGVLQMEKRRPVDILQKILEEERSGAGEKLRTFFEAYGPAEASAMAIMLAAAKPGSGVSVLAIQEAASLLEDPMLVGEPRLPEDIMRTNAASNAGAAAAGASGVGAMGAASTAAGVSGSLQQGGFAANSIYMGQAVNPNPEPEWSAAHRGLCLYIHRLVQPVWDQRVAAPRGKGGLLHCKFSDRSMEAVCERLQGLAALLKTYLDRRHLRGYSRFASGGAAMLPRSAGAGGDGTAFLALPGGGGMGGPSGYFLSGSGLGGGEVDAGQQAAKRQRLTHAAMLEDERTARIRSLAIRTSEALGLLRLLNANNLGRLATRLDEPARKYLMELTLRDLVVDTAGEASATQLISALVTDQLEASSGGVGAGLGAAAAGVEAAASALQRACPSYFKEADRTFYQASAKLKQAEAISGAAEREAVTKEAVAQLCQVALSCNLEYVTSQLAYLRCYEGLGELILKAATASDPQDISSRPELGADCNTARSRRSACYQHVINTLTALIQGAPPPPSGGGGTTSMSAIGGGEGGKGPAGTVGITAGAGPGGSCGPKPLTASERGTYRGSLMKVLTKSSDVYFHHVLYGCLIDMGQTSLLLSLDSPHLEAYLVQEAWGAAGATANLSATALSGGPLPLVGPLGKRQVQAADLLSKMCVGKNRFREACSVMLALAARRGGPGEQSVSLEERLRCLEGAVLQAKSVGDASLVDYSESELRRLNIQKAVHDRLKELKAKPKSVDSTLTTASANSTPGGGNGADTSWNEEMERLLNNLEVGLKDVSELYNDYAQPLKMWDVCLRLVDFTGSNVEPSLVRQLWDHLLIQTWSQSGVEGAVTLRLQKLAECVEVLGSGFYPNEVTFPTSFLTFRLEQAAAGLWPPGPSGSTEAAAINSVESAAAGPLIVKAVQRSCGGSLPSVQRTYDQLLARRANGVSDAALSNVVLRTQLLRSLLEYCRLVEDELSSTLINPGYAANAGASSSMLIIAATTPSMTALFGSSSAQRDAGNLADASERYSTEARRLGTSVCDQLALQFDALRRRLNERLSVA